MKTSINLTKAINITKRLLDLSYYCKDNIKLQKRFNLMSVNFVILLTETFTIDLVKDIITNTQFTINSKEAFDSTIELLKITLNKLEGFKKNG